MARSQMGHLLEANGLHDRNDVFLGAGFAVQFPDLVHARAGDAEELLGQSLCRSNSNNGSLLSI